MFAAEIQKRRIEGMKSSRWRWRLDEIFVKISGERRYLWRAVDHEGEVFESFVTKTRDKKTALKFLKKAMHKHGQPEVIATDRLRSYGAALRDIGAGERQETGRWLNNRAENSHLALLRRERPMLRFRRLRSRQKFAAVRASVSHHSNQERSLCVSGFWTKRSGYLDGMKFQVSSSSSLLCGWPLAMAARSDI